MSLSTVRLVNKSARQHHPFRRHLSGVSWRNRPSGRLSQGAISTVRSGHCGAVPLPGRVASAPVSVPRAKPDQDPLHERILQTATTLFGERGVDSTSMREIAERVGVTKAAIYYHFENKDQLHFAIHLRLIDEVLAQIGEIADSGADPAEKIRLVVELNLRSIAENRGAFTVLLREGGSLGDPHWSELAEKRDAFRRRVADFIAEGEASGVFVVEDVGIATLALLGMCNWAYTWIDPRGKVPVESIARQFSDIFIEGLRPRRGA
jgi:TetR/AcrR family transcriptional regulator, cholesterol catabolism regulator